MMPAIVVTIASSRRNIALSFRRVFYSPFLSFFVLAHLQPTYNQGGHYLQFLQKC